MCQNSRGDYSKVHAETIAESRRFTLRGRSEIHALCKMCQPEAHIKVRVGRGAERVCKPDAQERFPFRWIFTVNLSLSTP